jgi:hypothetical protein
MKKFEREIERLAEKDTCSMCDKPFPHNSTTFMGETVAGKAALVGNCCMSKLVKTRGVGLYVKRPYEGLLQGPIGETYTLEQAAKAVVTNQKRVAELDKFGEQLAKK